MDKKLKISEYIYIASMLFGLFFGAGNLIFPAQMGQLAGREMWSAAAGFIVTGVGLPLLAIIAMGISRAGSLLEMSRRVSKAYGTVFTIALYLTIGPLFAVPRTATVSFAVGLEPVLGTESGIWLPIFSLLFFGAALFFTLRPSGILTWVGKILNPLFLLCLAVLVITALTNPIGDISAAAPDASYAGHSFTTGFMEGYNTMDVLAALAFGIVVINVIRGMGISKPEKVAGGMIKAGALSLAAMALIYVSIIAVGAESRGQINILDNGGAVLAAVAGHYFGGVGQLLLAAMITLACLKTAVGLLTSISETFSEMSGGKISYRIFALVLTVISLLIANLGLNRIIEYSLPVLMLIYPLAITLILLNLFGRFFNYSAVVFRTATAFCAVPALLDFAKALPDGPRSALHADVLTTFTDRLLPFAGIGLGWIVPSAIGTAVGLIIYYAKSKKHA